MRKYAFVLILSILLVFGCGKKDNSTFQKEFQDKPTTEQDTSKSESDEKEGKYLDKAITLTEKELRGEVVEGEYHITGYVSDARHVIVPDKVQDVPVTRVGGFVFAGTPIESVVFPDTVEIIGESQFNSCNELRTVVFGNGLKEIGTLSFAECANLEKVVFPDGLIKIDGMCFGNCSNLKEIFVPSSVIDFGEGIPLILTDTCPDAVIITPAGSPAEAVCKENDIPVRTE